jgi:hypothetical protein
MEKRKIFPLSGFEPRKTSQKPVLHRRNDAGRDNSVPLIQKDCLCGLAFRVLDYRSGGPGSIPGTTRKKVIGLERGPLSLVSTTEELLDRKVAAPV